MKKTLLMIMAGLLIAIIAACGTNDETPETPKTSVEENSQKEVVEENEAENDGFETAVGETIENEGGKFTLLSRTSNIPQQETGPIILNITQVNTAIGELKGDMVDFFETDTINYIQIDMEVENTSEDTITFYASQATITTNTGEQLESDMWMSDHLDGDYFGAVKKSGSQFFILEKSLAEEIEWVRIIISAPTDEDWDDVGEKLDFKIELN